MHYNTTGETGAVRAELNGHASDQEQNILAFFRANLMKPYTAEQIMEQFNLPRTSVSRALCNLTDRRAIRKSSEARWKSSYGRSCHAWRAE